MHQATTVEIKTYISLSADPTLIILSFNVYSVIFARFVDYKCFVLDLFLLLVNYFAKFPAYSTNNP